MLLLWNIVAIAAAAECPDGTEAVSVDGEERCGRQDGDIVVLLAADGAREESGALADGRRTGWWTRWSPEGRDLGETRYEAGVAVDGLKGPTGRPRCLAEPPADGLYALAVAGGEPILSRPVAVVAGCVGATAGDAWLHGVRVVGPDRFVAVDSDGKRCNSGTTAEYVVADEGLVATSQVWTLCGGGGAVRDSAPVGLVRTDLPTESDEDVFAAMDRPEEAVRAAALEAIAALQPDRRTCDRIGLAIRGTLGAEAAARAVELATAPCLAEDLRVALFDHRYAPAADALARTADPHDVPKDLLRVVRAGLTGSPAPFAARIAALGPEPALRDDLGAALLDPDGTPESRQAAVDALDRLFREPDDGAALIAKADRHACVGWDELLGTAAAQAYVGQASPRAVRKIEAVRARCD